VGGIHAEVGQPILKNYFEQFANVTKIELVMNSKTGRSKGYAFVTCSTDTGAQEIMNRDTHILYGRKLDIGIAANKSQSKQIKKNLSQRKVFISGIGAEVTDSDLEYEFSKFGEINKAYAIVDPDKQHRISFGYVVFRHKRAADRSLRAQSLLIKNSLILIEAYKTQQETMNLGRTRGWKNHSRPLQPK
jgi:RNA recognition motif-containing protein